MSQFLEGFVLFHAAGRKMDEQFVNCKVLTRCAGQRYPFGEQLVPILTAFVSCLLQDLSPQLSLIRKVCCLGILGIQSSDSLHPVNTAVQVPARADIVFVRNKPSLEAMLPF